MEKKIIIFKNQEYKLNYLTSSILEKDYGILSQSFNYSDIPGDRTKLLQKIVSMECDFVGMIAEDVLEELSMANNMSSYKSLREKHNKVFQKVRIRLDLCPDNEDKLFEILGMVNEYSLCMSKMFEDSRGERK